MQETTEIDTEPVILKLTSDSKYDKPEVREYIVRKNNEGWNNTQIADGLRERGYDKITPQTVSELRKLVIARATVQSNTVSEQFEEYQVMLKDTFGESIKALGEYVKAIRVLQEEFDKVRTEDGDLDVVKAKMAIFKTIPQAVGLMREIRSYMEFATEMVNEVKTTTKEGVIYSTEQIMSQVNDYWPMYLRDAEKRGDIKILNKNILK
jgi:hypothetical protein